jgi:hypothetical protein
MKLRPPSIVAYLRKRNNVVLSHCCSSAKVIELREPHTCNNIFIIVRITVICEPLREVLFSAFSLLSLF